MLKQIIVATFVVSVNLKGTHGLCYLCPNAMTSGYFNPYTACPCEDAYYDPFTGKCGDATDCYGSANAPVPNSNTIDSFILAGVEAITSAVLNNSMDLLIEDTLDFLLPNATTIIQEFKKKALEMFKDVDIMNAIIRKRLSKEIHEAARNVTSLLNPYVLNNRNLLRTCNNKPLCLLGRLLRTTNRKFLESKLTPILPRIMDQLIAALNDIDDFSKRNCSNGCFLTKEVLKWKEFLTQTLLGMKDTGAGWGRYVVEAIINMESKENKAANNAVPKSGSSKQ